MRRLRLDLMALIATLMLFGLCNWIISLANTVATLDLGQGRTIVIYSKAEWEVNRPLLFQIRDGLGGVKEGCFIEADVPDSPHGFAVVFADNRSVVGVLDYALGPQLLIMYDFSSNNRVWPCEIGDRERDILFERLKSENPSLEEPEGNPPYY